MKLRFIFLFLFVTLNCFSLILGMSNTSFIILLNGPSSAGKSTIAKKFLKMANFNKDWVLVCSDDISDLDAGISDSDDDETAILKLHLCTINKIKNICRLGKNVICDTILTEPKFVEMFIQDLGQCSHLIMCFIHNPLVRLIKNLEFRNEFARKENLDIEERSLSQILKDFGCFYLPSECEMGLGEISKKDVSYVVGSPEANLFRRRNQRPESQVDPMFELFDRVLNAYPVFSDVCKNAHTYLKLKFNKYDLVIENKDPGKSAQKILKYISSHMFSI